MKTARVVGVGVAFVLAITFVLNGQIAVAAIPVETISESATNAGKLPDPGDDGNGGASSNIFNRSSYVLPDYGTNLWIANFALSPGNAVGILSNSLADVLYEIQYKHDLTADTQWLSGGVVYGSELTNWTTLVMTNVSLANNAVFRIRSWQDDGSGLPIWWQLQNFGYVGVDPYGNPTGDGWSNIQKFQNGMNPNAFYIPPAPQGLAVNYNPANNTANISWFPTSGSVIGYTVTRNNNGDVTNFNFSAATRNFTDATQPQTPDLNEWWVSPISYNPTYQVQAQYTGGHSSVWSAAVKLLNSQSAGAILMVPDSQSAANLVLSGLPQNLATLRLTRIGPWDSYGDPLGDTIATSFDIPAASLNNGAYALSSSQAVPTNGAFYAWWVQAVSANGSPSDAMGPNSSWKPTLFVDGRVQLKQNLIFQLRAATRNEPFHFAQVYSQSQYYTGTYPTSYAYASVWEPTGQYWDNGDEIFDMEPTRPFADNYLYRNFVFNASELNANGHTTTGAGGNYNTYPFGLTLSIPPTYQLPTTNWTTLPALMATNNTRWLCSYPLDSALHYLEEIGVTNEYSYSPAINAMYNNVSNYFGLRFLSAKIGYGNGSAFTLSAGSSTTQGGYFYPETVQPQFQTVEYDFWKMPYYLPWTYIPGMPEFSTTNKSSLLITTVANWIQAVGYAKLAVTNGYSGVYGYLGQYFDKAYTEDINGVATTNSAGILDAYGNFYPTMAGPAALMTMPDVDTGARGTCTVYCVSLQLDKNHDGNMDLSFSGPDTTSQASPATLWVNNDWDTAQTTVDGAPLEPGHDIPVSARDAYRDFGFNHIHSERDLEDFARLWICGVPALTNAESQVTLSWDTVSSGNPAIKLFKTAETNGGTAYLTDTNVALAQAYGAASSWTIGEVSSTHTLMLPGNLFTNSGNKYFLFEGSGIGAGQLIMTISQNSNTIAQTGVWLDLHDAKDFYERAVITNNISGAISNWTSSLQLVQPASSSALGEDTNLIVFVHGINVDDDDWRIESDTVFKRLYWAGYHGKFMTVKWPCNFLTPPRPVTLDVFNLSEANAYKASTSLTTYLNQLRSRFPGYRLNLFVHSQGNAMASEAIKNGASFDTYILTQGAISDGAYDVNATNFPALANEEHGNMITPDWQLMGYHGVYTNSNFTGKIVNFYNPNDPVLAVWIVDQVDLKPSGGYFYDGVNCRYTISSNIVTDFQETRSMVARSRSLSVGQSGPQSAHGVIKSAVDLSASFGFNKAFPDDHSAQWTWPIQTSLLYYYSVMSAYGIPTTQGQ